MQALPGKAGGVVKIRPERRHTAGVEGHSAIAVTLVATALALVVSAPLLPHFNDAIYGYPGDATGAVSQYWWWGYALTHGKNIFDNSLQGVPLGSGWSELPFVVLPLFVFTPLCAVIGPIASYNVLILSSFPLTAWATYLLGRRLGLSTLASAFAGLAFAFSPYHVEKAQGHGNQTHMEFIALALLFFLKWRETGRRRDAALVGAMLGLQFWMDYSLTLILAFGLAGVFAISFLAKVDSRSWSTWLVSNLAASGIAALVAALFVPLAVVFAHRPGSGSYAASFGGTLQEVTRGFDELMRYSARLREYIEPWHANPLVPSAIKQWEQANLHGSNWTESSLFLGYTVIALALVGLAVWRWRFSNLFAITLVAVGAAMAEPPMVHFFGHQLKAPSYFVYHFIHFFRVYARFAILVLLGACLLAGSGFAVLEHRLGGGRRRLVLLLPFALLAVEFNNIPPTHVTRLLPAPAEYAWLRDQPPGVLLEYPAHSGTGEDQEVEIRQYELYQMVHLHPTFLNEITQLGPVATAASQMEPYYKPGAVDEMRRYGVRYVFVHRREYVKAGWQLPQAVNGLTKVTTIDDVDVFVVNSKT